MNWARQKDGSWAAVGRDDVKFEATPCYVRSKLTSWTLEIKGKYQSNLPSLQMIKRRAEKIDATPYCGDCDGCGWVEGGKALKTTCSTCKGTGREP